MKLHESFVLILFTDICGFVLCLRPSLQDAASCANLHNGLQKQPPSVMIKRGEPLLLNCSLKNHFALDSKGLPLRNITWIKNGVPLESRNVLGRILFYSNGSLFVPQTRSTSNSENVVSDDGYYFCIVNSLTETYISSGIQVTIAALGRFSLPLQSTSRSNGFYHRFNCSIDKATPKPIITWFKDDIPVLNTSAYQTPGQFSKTQSSKRQLFSWTHSNLSMAILPNGVLEVGPITAKDAGDYYCSVNNGIRTRKSNTAVLTILPDADEGFANPISIEVTPSNTSTVLGLTSYLECFATGYPRPAITWEKNGVEIDFRSEPRLSVVGQGTLVLTQTNVDDAGRYSCKAHNEIGEPQTASAYITVLVPPKFKQQPDCRNFMVLGQSGMLQCSVHGYPKPSVIWFKNGHQLHATKRIQLIDQQIRISSASAEDVGVYNCFATNSVGTIVAAMEVVLAQTQDDDSTSSLSSIFDDYRSASSENSDLFLPNLKQLTTDSAVVTWKPPADIFSRGAKYKVVVNDLTTKSPRILSSNSREVLIRDLEPGHEMKVAVLKLQEKMQERSKELAFVVPAVLAEKAVRNFAVSVLSPTKLLASWDPPLSNGTTPRGYRVIVEEADSVTPNPRELEFVEPPAKIRSLSKYTRYALRVAALYERGGNGAYTPAVTVRTEGDVPDQVPPNITVTMARSDSFRIEWDTPNARAVNGELTGFRIKYKERDGKRSITRTVPLDSNHFLLGDLKRNTEYVVRMQILNNFGAGPFSKRYTFQTPRRVRPESNPPGRPRLLETKTSPTSIIVSWEPPEGNVYVRDYIIGWGTRAPQEERRLDGKKRIYEIIRLEPSTQYFLSVRAGNQAGLGEKYLAKARTKATEDHPEELYPPLGVHVTVLTSTTLNVSWHDSNEKRDSRYYVVRYKTNLPEKPRVWLVNSTDLNCLIHGLRPHTYYEVAVRVIEDNRRSEWSMKETATTKESKPGTPPTDLTVVPVDDSPTSVQLNWQPPDEPNGDLNGYLIFYTTEPKHSIANWVIEPVVGDAMTAVIDGLTPDTQYYFKAQGRNVAGYSPLSEAVGYRTSKSPEVAEVRRWSMPPWMWYIIIGGITVLVVCVVVIATLVICRNRSSSGRRSKDQYKKPSNAGSPRKLADSSRLYDHQNNCNVDKHGSRFTYRDYPPYVGPSTDLIPVSSKMLPHQDPGYVPGYPYATYHPSVLNNGLRSTGTYSLDLPSHFSDAGLNVHDDHITSHTSFLPSGYNVESRYSPLTSGTLYSPDGNGDSAYGSDYPALCPTDESPQATVQHGRTYSSAQSKFLAKGKASSIPSSRTSEGQPDSARDSRSESLLTDDMNAELANVVEFVQDMKASTHDTEGFLK